MVINSVQSNKQGMVTGIEKMLAVFGVFFILVNSYNYLINYQITDSEVDTNSKRITTGLWTAKSATDTALKSLLSNLIFIISVFSSLCSKIFC